MAYEYAPEPGEYDPEYEDILYDEWLAARDAYTQSSGHARILFTDHLTPTLEPDQHATYFGDIIDVGEDQIGQWIDIRLLEHAVCNDAYIQSKCDIASEMCEDIPPDEVETTLEANPELSQKWDNLDAMNESLQLLLRNRSLLEVSDRHVRFYMHDIGPDSLSFPLIVQR